MENVDFVYVQNWCPGTVPEYADRWVLYEHTLQFSSTHTRRLYNGTKMGTGCLCAHAFRLSSEAIHCFAYPKFPVSFMFQPRCTQGVNTTSLCVLLSGTSAWAPSVNLVLVKIKTLSVLKSLYMLPLLKCRLVVFKSATSFFRGRRPQHRDQGL